MDYWAFEPGAKWHGFEGYGKGQYFIDPMKLQFVTCGIDIENGGYEEFGIPGNILANYLRENGIIPEKCDLNDILFLMTPAESKTKMDDLVAKLIRFEKLIDEDAPMAEVLPSIYKAYEDKYKGYTIRQLCQEMHDFYKDRKVFTLQKNLFLHDYLPEYVINPQKPSMNSCADMANWWTWNRRKAASRWKVHFPIRQVYSASTRVKDGPKLPLNTSLTL